MNYLHQEIELDAEDVVEVTLDHPANVQLLSAHEFEQYQQGKPFRYAGGYFRESPARISAPYPGRWHVVVDLGGGAGSVRASLRILPDTTVSG
ncbi:MAG: DUF1883 domain-containing protein [Planctomycetes bacterium]|nr:DUF1883 domain-containing protein [Planctomycetota bacterium]